MVKIFPQIYRQKVIYEKGSLVLYVTLNKALYGWLVLALLLYELLVAYWEERGLSLTPTTHVWQKMIGGKQITVYWNVDYLKLSYVDPKEVTNFMEWIEGVYGELRVTRGKVHKYLGMVLDLWTPGELRVTMVDYI